MSTAAETPTPPADQPRRRRPAIGEMPWWVEKLVVPLLFLLVAALLPFLFDTGSSFIGTCVLALA